MKKSLRFNEVFLPKRGSSPPRKGAVISRICSSGLKKSLVFIQKTL